MVAHPNRNPNPNPNPNPQPKPKPKPKPNPNPNQVAATLSFSFALANSSSAAPPPRVAPPAREVARRVLPSGAVLRCLDDGSRTLYLRSGNVGTCAGPDGPHAGCWVSTNLAGLRAGTRPGTGEEFYVPSVAVAPATDPVTLVRVRVWFTPQATPPPPLPLTPTLPCP